MSFGSKNYQHRFYTAPKMRSRHVNQFVINSPDNQRQRSISAFNPHLQEETMKSSYLKLVNSGINSRLYTKDQLGYQGLKFQKDVIDRYSNDDYAANCIILQKFRRQAQQQKKRTKYSHLRRQSTNQNQKIFASNDNIILNKNKKSMELYPVTNTFYLKNIIKRPNESIIHQQNAGFQQNQYARRKKLGEQNIKFLPQITKRKSEPYNQRTSRSVIIDEESSYQNTQQEIQNIDQIQQNDENSAYEVGVNTNLSFIKQKLDKRKKTKKYIDEEKSLNKFQFLKLQTQKYKNNILKKKYNKLKKKFVKKSLIISKIQDKQKQKQTIQTNNQFEQRIQNLSEMVHDLYHKLRQNNHAVAKNWNHYQLNNQLDQKIKTKNQVRVANNQTQINLLKTERQYQKIDHTQKQPSSIENEQAYFQDLKNKNQKAKPKVIYSFNTESKNVKIDALRLLKNRMRQKNFYIQSLGDYSYKRPKRSKTEPI